MRIKKLKSNMNLNLLATHSCKKSAVALFVSLSFALCSGPVFAAGTSSLPPSLGNSDLTNSLLIAGNKVMFDFFSQSNFNFNTTPSSDNHKIASVFSPSLAYSYSTGASSAALVSNVFSNFRKNYNGVDSFNGSSPDASSVPSDNILYAKGACRQIFNGVTMMPNYACSQAHHPDNKFNLAVLVAADRIDPPIKQNGKILSDSNAIAQAEAAMNPVLLTLANQRHCQNLAQGLVNADQRFADSINVDNLKTINDNDQLKAKLSVDQWSKPAADDTDAQFKSVGVNTKSDSSSDGNKEGGASVDSYVSSTGYVPYGAPLFGSYLKILHQVTTAKTLSYATVYQICMARSPVHDKVGQPTESPMQKMADHVNQVSNEHYLKTIQSQGLNANIKELVKQQGQSLQMMMQLHRDNDVTNANLAALSAVNASTYATLAEQSSSMGINKELDSIIQAAPKK